MRTMARVQSCRGGFTLIEMMVVVLAIALLSAAAVMALAPEEERPVVVSMMGDVERFAAVEVRAYHLRGAYDEPRAVLSSGVSGLSPGVEVDSVAFTPGRVYLRVRHPASSQRCSVDLSQVSTTARNRVRCFGGTARDSTEVVGIGDGPETPVADTTAGVLPPAPPAVALVVGPSVGDPSDVTLKPGEVLDQSFVVTNSSATARSYRFAFSSSDPALVAVPANPANATIAAGGSWPVRFTSNMALGAPAGRVAAVSLEAIDLGEDALVGRGSFAAMAGVDLQAAGIESPGGATVAPGDTATFTWLVVSRSNVARTLAISAAPGGSSLVLVDAGGVGKLRFEPGEVREVVTRYRLGAPSSAGSLATVWLQVDDAGAAALKSTAQAEVTTALVIAPPDVVAPADTVVGGGVTFTRAWTITGRTNAARSYSVAASAVGSALESVSVLGSTAQTIAENGSVQVLVSCRVSPNAPAGTSSTVRLTARDDAGGVEGSGSMSVSVAATPVAPTVSAPGSVARFAGESASLSFAVRNPGNASRRFSIVATSDDPDVASVQQAPTEVQVPAFASVDVPVAVAFPIGPVQRLGAGITLTAQDAADPSLSGSAVAGVIRVNRPPTVTLTGPSRDVAAGEDVEFAMAGSDPDGDALGYGVEFGDGMSASGSTVTHAYFAPGTYYVRAKVVDAFGLAAEDSLIVRVIAPTLGCMDPAANNYDPNANLPGDCTYGPTLVKTEELQRQFVCDYEQGFVQYRAIDTWGRMYDHWSDGSQTAAGDPYQISYEVVDLGPVTAAPYGLTCDTYTDDWP